MFTIHATSSTIQNGHGICVWQYGEHSYCDEPRRVRFCPAGSLQQSRQIAPRPLRRARFFYWTSVLLLNLVCSGLMAQSYEKLNALKGHHAQVYFSSGAEIKAKRMAVQLDGVISFFQKHLGFSPTVKLAILSPADWQVYTRNAVYGMPHFDDNQTLFVAADNNDFWRSFVPPTDKLPAEFSRLIVETYTNKSGELSMEPFFDLLAIHELGHAYHFQDSLVMQRKWMGELFANILLHTYVAEVEPQLLPALTVFPRMVVSTTDRSGLKYTTLEQLETNYNELGQKYPVNYGWYQCRWHMAAGSIYDAAGLTAIKNLWSVLKSQRAILNDDLFVKMLDTRVHPSVASVPLKWNGAE